MTDMLTQAMTEAELIEELRSRGYDAKGLKDAKRRRGCVAGAEKLIPVTYTDLSPQFATPVKFIRYLHDGEDPRVKLGTVKVRATTNDTGGRVLEMTVGGMTTEPMRRGARNGR